MDNFNKLDDLIDKVIDDFYVYLQNDKKIKIIIKEVNFVKYQKEINDILISYIKTLPINTIKEIIKKQDSILLIIDIIKKYLFIYIILLISYEFTQKEDLFINNILEFTKNQNSYNYKINDFFNSKSNSLLIEHHYIIKNIRYILNKHDINILQTQQYGNETIKILTYLGEEFVKSIFKESHDIIKTLIVLYYSKTDKIILTKLIEEIELNEEEYIFIDIIEPLIQIIDISVIENILINIKKNKKDYILYSIWNYITQPQKLNILSVDEKINTLLNNGSIIPITDDFLLYHKDFERYENIKETKKEDIKIKYILNKIDNVSELYSKKNKEEIDKINKYFYSSMSNRRVITINDIEDIKIINKYLNQTKINLELLEYVNDFISYKLYPYINFRDYRHDMATLSIMTNNTILACRSTNFDYSSRDILEWRIGSDGMILNIIGLLLLPNKLQCTKNIGIKKVNGNKIDHYIKEKLRNKLNNGICWLFEKNNEINNETIKNRIGILYNNYIDECYDIIVSKINKNMTLNNISNIVDTFVLNHVPIYNKIIQISPKTILFNTSELNDLFIKVESYIYSNISQSDDIIDDNENKIYGMYDNIIILPELPDHGDNKNKLIQINLSKTKIDELQKEISISNGVCQHSVTWDNIVELKKIDQKKYAEELFEFTKQYVDITNEQEYICKSCGTYLEIKKYIIGGSYDNDSKKFISHSLPIDISLEDSEDYSKYKQTIRILDKMIEKIATISNIPHLMGSFTTNKLKRKMIIKNVIDIIISNNSILKNKYKERKEVASKLYGLGNFSNLFTFDLDNSILQFTSKDKDQYRPIKINNIIIYLLIFIVLDLNELQIKFLSDDNKYMCNYDNFNKIYMSLFSELKIRKNNMNELLSIKEYKILCYILYILSCKIIKYQLWQYDYAPTFNKKLKQLPIIQKTIITTYIDIVNSILENSYTKNITYIFEIFRSKFYDKLYSIFSGNFTKTIIEKKNISDITNTNIKIKKYQLNGIFKEMSYDNFNFLSFQSATYYIPKYKKLTIKYNEINNITNCNTGHFHDWEPKEATFVCKKCGMKLADAKLDKNNKEIIEKLSNIFTQEIYDFICTNNKLNICDNKENFNKNYIKYKQHKSELEYTQFINIKNEINNENKYIDDLINKIRKNISDFTSFEKYINLFINDIRKITDKNNINNTELVDNYYIIDHDYLGNKLDKSIMIENSKVQYKENNSIFNTSVFYYTVYSPSKITLYYNAISKKYLGYKEESKDYVFNNKSNNYLIINYSLQSKIYLLGFKTFYYNKEDDLNKILDNRLINLKHMLYYLSIIFYRIFNGYSLSLQTEDTYFYENKLFYLIDKYKNKFINLKLTDDNKKHPFYKHWKGLYKYNNEIDKLKNIDRNSFEINKLDTRSLYIIYYIISELHKLINYNQSLSKLNIISFSIDFINMIFDLYNKDNLNYNHEIIRFIHVLESSEYTHDLIQKTAVETVGLYEEYTDDEDEKTDEKKKEEKSKNDDINEQMDAMDISVDRDEFDTYDDDDTAIDYSAGYDMSDNYSADLSRYKPPDYEVYKDQSDIF